MGDLWLTSLVCISLSDLVGRDHICGVVGTDSHHSRCESVRASRAWIQPPPLLVPLSKLESLDTEVTWSWCWTRAQPSLDTPHPRLLPASAAPSARLSRMAALMFAAQSAASPGDSARNTQEVFWSGENISKHLTWKSQFCTLDKDNNQSYLAASSPVTHCFDKRQKCSGMLRESALGEAGGARPVSYEGTLVQDYNIMR